VEYENITTRRAWPHCCGTGQADRGQRGEAAQSIRIVRHPANAKAAAQIGASVMREGTPILTLDGHMP
jgi:hypothetical protein